MPKSLAICVSVFLLDCAICTASSLNSLVKVRCVFCMALSLSVEVHSFKFTFHIFLGQDQECKMTLEIAVQRKTHKLVNIPLIILPVCLLARIPMQKRVTMNTGRV